MEGTARVSRTISFAVDEVARAAQQARRAAPGADEMRCDACDAVIEGEAAGRGLYVWTRGDEVRYEEPPLCEGCATAIGVTALAEWDAEEEEG